MGSVTMRLALYIIVVGLPPLLPVKLPSHPFPGTLIKLMPLVLTLKLMDKDNKLPKKPITLLPLRIFPTLMLHTKLENTSSSENTTNQLLRITSLSSMNLPSMVHATKKSPLNASMDGFSLETGPKKTHAAMEDCVRTKAGCATHWDQLPQAEKEKLAAHYKTDVANLKKPTLLSSREPKLNFKKLKLLT